MEISQLLIAEKANFDQIIELQDMLANIDQISFEEITNFISSKFLASKETIRQLLYSIKFAIEWRPKNFEYYCQLIEIESEIIKENFTSDELCIEILTNDFLRLRLYELNLINLNSIKKLSIMNRSSLLFFKPEIENDQIDKEKDLLRHEGMHENELFRLIRNDDLEKFQQILSNSAVDVNMKVNFSNYEISTIINDFYRMPNLIEYSAFFGSVNIFKFLILNGAHITSRVSQFAVAGGNYEIIHILEEKEISFEKTMYFALRFHRNEVANYLNEKHGIQFTTVMFQTCVLYYNVEELVELFSTIEDFDINAKDHGMTIFMFAAENGYFDLVRWISMIKGIDINASNEVNVFKKKSFWNALLLAVENDHAEIVRFLVSLEGIDVNAQDYQKDTALHLAVSSQKVEIVKILLSYPKINVNLKNSNVFDCFAVVFS
ncbi:hypothetical protein M9Y10_014758 [Tritrichomonas musculus]|uniref:DUF3447 domain-containing protein n=1 Tax=Tritrichomonas musculus TaxID=1915356 RepID=A0ABR2L0E0_9EUKA